VPDLADLDGTLSRGDQHLARAKLAGSEAGEGEIVVMGQAFRVCSVSGRWRSGKEPCASLPGLSLYRLDAVSEIMYSFGGEEQ
jgi:hypothetical protein